MEMRQRPRVDKKRRLVCVHHRQLGCFEVYRINLNNTVNKSEHPVTTFAADWHEAIKKMPYPKAGFKTVKGMSKPKAKDWRGYIKEVWDASLKQKETTNV